MRVKVSGVRMDMLIPRFLLGSGCLQQKARVVFVSVRLTGLVRFVSVH